MNDTDKQAVPGTIRLEQNDNGKSRFLWDVSGVPLGEMVFTATPEMLTVHHTKVHKELEGKGVAGKLLAYMVAYARERHLKVLPLCPYVHAQFKRHPDQYDDIWFKQRV
jgi:predicted GNAT family acetyltransferase